MAAPEEHSARDDTEPLDRAAPPQREYANGPVGEPPVSPRDEVVSDRDLERLEASLRWLQLEEAAKRIAHETRSPPAPFRPEAAAQYPDSDRVGFRSPPSLEPAQTPPAGELRPAGGDKHDPLQSPYAPKHARLRSKPAPEEYSARDDTAPLDGAAPPQREYANGPVGEPPVSPRDEVVSDRDLERLKASLRWSQHEEAAKRIAHEALPPPAPFRPEAARYPDSDRVGFRSPPSLEARPTSPDGELRPAGADKHDPLQSPYAPKHVRLRSTPTKPLDRPASPQREYANGNTGEQLVPPRDEMASASDRDLERIDATLLRWSQREEAAKRIAHETRPPPALFRGGAAIRYPDSDRVGFRSPPSLEPEHMPPPPRRAHRHAFSWLLPILIAAGSAGALGYYFSADSWVPAWTPVPLSQFASYLQGFHAPRPNGQERTGPIGSRNDDSGTSIRSIQFRQADVGPIGPSPAGETVERPPAAETVVLLPPKATGAETPPPSKPVRVLDREEIELLMNQGEEFAAVGDLAAARTVFQRAAEAGNAKAAVALASTYDPAVLKKLGVVGMHADVKKAQSWYQKAESLGSAEATLRLQILAKR